MIAVKVWVISVFIGMGLLNCALAEASGTKLWQVDAGGRVTSSPALHKDGFLVFGAGGKLVALNRNGSVKWKLAVKGALMSSPAIDTNGIIYIGSLDGNLYAAKADGTLAWRQPTQGPIYSSPALDVDGTIYVGSDDRHLYAVGPGGKVKWTFATGGYVRSSPAVGASGTIYFGSWDNRIYAVSRAGQQVWSFAAANSIFSSPAVAADGTIYFGSIDHKVYALNADGTKKWEFPSLGHIYASPAIAPDGTVYCGSWDNRLYAISNAGTQKWAMVTGDLVQSSPAVGKDGTIYFGSDEKKLYAINADGTKKWELVTTSLVRSSPLITPDGVIYFGAEDGQFYAIQGGMGVAASSWPLFRGSPMRRGKVLLVVTGQPANKQTILGSSVTFNVTASGPEPIKYQWLFNGNKITNGLSAALILTNVQPHQAGKYAALVYNDSESLTSSPAELEVVVVPSIQTQPQSQMVTVGSDVMFRISANSLGAVSYQWALNGTNLPGATVETLIIPEVQLRHAGKYTIIASNAAGVVTSEAAILTVVTPPVITKKPQPQVVAAGGLATFTVEASSSGTLNYQWRLGGTNLAKANGPSYSITNVNYSQIGDYSVVVGNMAGSVTSSVATLAIPQPPHIQSPLKDQTVILGGQVTFQVAAGNPVQHQWLFNSAPITNATNASFVLTEVKPAHAGLYSVVLSNIAGCLTSPAASLTVLVPPTIIKPLANQTGAIHSDVVFNIQADGTPPLDYQWRFHGTNMPGLIGNTLALQRVHPALAGPYTVVIVNSGGSVTSNPALLVIPSQPSFWMHLKSWF